MNTNLPYVTEEINVHEIKTSGFEVISKLSWDFKTVLNQNFSKEGCFHVPLNTVVSINSNNKSSSKIIFSNPSFVFEITIDALAWGSGLHHKNPEYQVLLNRYGAYAQNDAMQNYMYFDGAGYLTANFDSPMYDIDTFKKHLHYYESIKKLLEKHWNFNKVIDNLSHTDIRVIHSKIDDILNLVQPESPNPS